MATDDGSDDAITRDRLIHAMLYFCQHTQRCNKLKLSGLLYLLDFKHLAITGETVTSANYHARNEGPMAVSLFHQFDLDLCDDLRDNFSYTSDRDTIRPLGRFQSSHFTQMQRDILSCVVSLLADATPSETMAKARGFNSAWYRSRKQTYPEGLILQFRAGGQAELRPRERVTKTETAEQIYEALRLTR